MRLIVLIFFIFISSLVFAYELRLHPQEKENIIKAVNSGTKIYALKKNSIVYDLIDNEKLYLRESIVAAFFNEPTLSGHRYMETNGKVRFIVDQKFLRDTTQVLQMRPKPQFYKPTSGKIPKIPVGAPHEFEK